LYAVSSVTEKQCTQSGACVLLSVMDHDVLSANDFAGEVCIGLQQVIAGMGSSALLPLNLPIVNYDAPPITSTGTSVACYVHIPSSPNYYLVA